MNLALLFILHSLEYFEKLPIPKEFAEHVKEIDMDGGNEIYMNLITQ